MRFTTTPTKIVKTNDPEVNAWIKGLIWTHCGSVTKPEETTEEIMFRCPFCGDSKTKRKKRGHYYKKTGSYYCFNGGCNRAATWQQLAAQLTGMTIEQVEAEMINHRLSTGTGENSGNFLKELEEAERKAQEFVNKALNIDPVPLECKMPTGLIHWKDHPATKEYIENRVADLADFKPDNLDFWYWPEEYRIVFPWLDFKGNVNYWQARATLKFQDPKYKFPPDTSIPIFPMKHDPSWKAYVCVEGVFDGIWVKNGLVVGSCKTTMLQQRMLHHLRKDGYQLIWLLDNQIMDEAARKSISKMVNKPSFGNDLFFQWPTELKAYKDVNDAILDLGYNPFADKDFILRNSITVPEMIVKLV